MRTLFVVLGFIAAILALILAVTPLFKIGFMPSIAALAFGFVALYFANKKQQHKKSIQLVFIMTIIALTIITFKTVFNTVEVGNTEELIQKEEDSEQEAIETLEDIEIDE